ncbi:RNA polymerase factor sigma-32 [Stagnihabitans tardus]|uniref:RNA polymerase factor sigma-32 n=1 Tax=Stagnihabitans tardus TaxID=2699202 RepID=A0AAE4Y9M4_9RHOB|nr:RNA polymerase factor sigma-32 [Stagnihabitans tardus]NBZ88531.1 RNA polymerase factor sigma-32 [Stagnihabitans tardus]
MALDQFADPRLALRARRAELLSAEQEGALARAWRDHRDSAALDRLITAYMRLAISMAMKFRRYGAGMGDLTQEAALGLMKAAEKFDPDRGVRFSTYAMFWIKAQLQDYVMRNWSLVRTGSTTSQKSLFFNMRRVEARLAREASARGEKLEGEALSRAVAEELGVPLHDVLMMEGRLAGSDASLNATQSSDEDGREWIDVLEDDQPAPFVQDHDQAILRRKLADAMATLSPRERLIVRERQLSDEPRTLESLGEELKLSKERIRQLEAAAFVKLRRQLEAQGMGDLLR